MKYGIFAAIGFGDFAPITWCWSSFSMCFLRLSSKTTCFASDLGRRFTALTHKSVASDSKAVQDCRRQVRNNAERPFRISKTETSGELIVQAVLIRST